jgi:hypothetical protein
VDCLVNGVLPITAVNNSATGGDICGAGNPNFANFNTPTTTYDPAILSGWGKRPYDWNFGIQAQQQLLPRVSVDVGYFRRIFGNFSATDNRAQNLFAQTTQLSVPSDSRLPDGGGQPLPNPIYNVDPSQFGRTDNLVNLARLLDLHQEQHWNGVEVNVSARVRNGLTLSGGTSTGRTSTDTCEVRAALPGNRAHESVLSRKQPLPDADQGLASYVVPKIDVSVSTAVQSIPGRQSQRELHGSWRAAGRRRSAAPPPVSRRSTSSPRVPCKATGSTRSTSGRARLCGSRDSGPSSAWICITR